MSISDVSNNKSATEIGSLEESSLEEPSLEEPSLEERVGALEKRLEEVEEALPEDKVALVVFSGDLDRVLASFVIATGAAAMGQEVSMFFTFWGLSVLKDDSSL